MELEILKAFGKFKEGQTITVKGKKVPEDIYWRRRLKDAEIDGCVKIIKKKRTK